MNDNRIKCDRTIKRAVTFLRMKAAGEKLKTRSTRPGVSSLLLLLPFPLVILIKRIPLRFSSQRKRLGETVGTRDNVVVPSLAAFTRMHSQKMHVSYVHRTQSPCNGLLISRRSRKCIDTRCISSSQYTFVCPRAVFDATSPLIVRAFDERSETAALKRSARACAKKTAIE